MLVTTFIHATRPSLMQARRERAQYIARLLRIAGKRLARRVGGWREQIALARQHRRELAELLHADERMLADIGLTRADVNAMMRSRWSAAGRMIEAASRRRRETNRVAATRHALPRVAAPSLTPGAPMRLVMMDTSNFR